jgi:hypothetical protein
MSIIPGIFALLVAAAGWFYLFYSRAAEKLALIEDASLNLRRVRLRRASGLLLILLGMLLYAGSYSLDWDKPSIWFLVIWLSVMVLVGVVTLLALLDLRLTQKLRHSRKREET